MDKRGFKSYLEYANMMVALKDDFLSVKEIMIKLDMKKTTCYEKVQELLKHDLIRVTGEHFNKKTGKTVVLYGR